MNTSSDTQHQSITPDPGVTTPPTDEQPDVSHLLTAMQLITKHSTHGASDRLDFAQAIAHALRDAYVNGRKEGTR